MLTLLRISVLFIVWYFSACVNSNEVTNETDIPSLDSLRGCLLEGDRNAVYVSIAEDMPKGSVIHQHLPIIGSTSDEGPNKEIRLRVVKGGRYASLDEAKKQLSFNKRIDRDGEGGITNFEVVLECVPVVGIGPLLSSQQGVNISVFVTVTDVNDNGPEFPQNHYLLSVPEELPTGTPVQLDFAAMDRDEEGPNSQIKYRVVVEGEGEEGTDGYLSIADPLIPQLVIGPRRIDFESTKSFDVVIEAEDEGSPPRRSTAHVHVEVMDVDDLNPVFEHDVYTAHINGDGDAMSHADGVALGLGPKSLRAYDPDSTLDERIVYSLPRGLGTFTEVARNFSIDTDTGTLRYFGDLRQLRRTPVVLAVHAKQHDRPERNATAVIVIGWEGQNRGSSEGGGLNRNYVYHIEAPLRVMPGGELLRLKGSNDGLRWHYRMATDDGSAASMITLDEVAGVLYLADGVSRGVAKTAIPSELSVKVLAFALNESGDSADDSEEDPIEHTVVVNFRSSIGKGAGPVFDEDEYQFSIGQISSPSSSVVLGQIRASVAAVVVDGKRQPDNKVFYSLLNMNSHFSLNPDGILSHHGTHSNPLNIVLVWRGVEEPLPHLPQTAIPNGEYRIELVVVAEDMDGRKSFTRIVVKLPVPRHQVSLSVMFGVACFLFLLSNLVLLTVLFGKRVGRRMMGATHTSNRLWLPSLMSSDNEGVTITSSIPTATMDQDFPALSISNPIPATISARPVETSSTMRSHYSIDKHGPIVMSSAASDRRSSDSNRGTLISLGSAKSGSRRNI